MTIFSLFAARRMGKSDIQRMYMEYIKEKIMNEQERSLDLQLGDALAENRALKAAAQAGLDALGSSLGYVSSETRNGIEILEAITQLQAALKEKT